MTLILLLSSRSTSVTLLKFYIKFVFAAFICRRSFLRHCLTSSMFFKSSIVSTESTISSVKQMLLNFSLLMLTLLASHLSVLEISSKAVMNVLGEIVFLCPTPLRKLIQRNWSSSLFVLQVPQDSCQELVDMRYQWNQPVVFNIFLVSSYRG